MNEAPRILVVDDFESMRRIVRQALNSVGYMDVTLADDGNTALRLLRREPFDCLVTDWLMPRMDGVELVRAIRADPRLCGLRVLMVSAEAERPRILEAVQAGIDDYIVKPFAAATLKQKIERLLSQPRPVPPSG